MSTGKPTDHGDHKPPTRKPTGMLEDRIPADGEQVAHTLNPDRRRDNVQFPDPQPPHTIDNETAVGAQSNAEVQMGRRTDAGPREAAAGPTSDETSKWHVWYGIAAVAILLFVLFAFFM